MLLCATHSAFAEEYRLKLITDFSQENLNLTWDSSRETQEPELQRKLNFDGNSVFFVVLKGFYKKIGGNLLYESQKLPIDSKGEFSMEVTDRFTTVQCHLT